MQNFLPSVIGQYICVTAFGLVIELTEISDLELLDAERDAVDENQIPMPSAFRLKCVDMLLVFPDLLQTFSPSPRLHCHYAH